MHIARAPDFARQFDAGRVTQSDLDTLKNRDPHAPHPYHGVAPHKGGWRGRAFRRQIGEVQPTPRAAAVLLILWWKATYGPRWADFWAYRQTQGWKVVSTWKTVRRAFGAGQTRVRVGCDVRVWDKDGPGGWLKANKRGVVLSGDRPNRPAFVDPPAARAAFRRWVRDTYGPLFAPLAGIDLRRRTTPTHRPARVTPVPQSGA